MKRKTMARVAVFMVVVFVAVVLVYPMIFGPNESQLAQPVAPTSQGPVGTDVTAPATAPTN